ncbi:MAG: hypothetical protein HKM24_05530 [Gammaproteobacteria bacterium]|nr:hypothetical protein [Gammaproteobacteria bacterium]
MGKLPASGVPELIPKWSEAAKASLTEAFQQWATAHDEFEFIEPPTLSNQQQMLLEEYLSLNQTVAVSAISAVTSLDYNWQHKREAFDYGIGPGLNFLADLSGANTALFIGGYQIRANQSRWATVIGLALLGVQAPLGNSVMIVGTIDLETGRTTWLNPQIGISGDPRKPDDAFKILSRLLDAYPGGQFFNRVTLAP